MSATGLSPKQFYVQGGPANADRSLDGYYPSYALNQEYYLANPVVETSQRFQFFEGGFATSGTPNVKFYKDRGRTSVNMGGCMGCHGNAQNTGLSFTLNNVKLDSTTGKYKGVPPGKHPVGTLTDTCDELGTTYDAAYMGCRLR